MNNTVLLVDDEANVLSALTRALVDEECDVLTAPGGEQALKLLAEHPVKVVVSDERMPGMSGSEFLEIVRTRYPHTVRIMLTGHASIEAAMRAVNSGEIYRFFTKPWNDVEIQLSIRSALDKFNLEEVNRRLLATVRRQAVERKLLEKRYPGITQLEKDSEGFVILPEIPEEEYADIVAECEQVHSG